MTKHFVFLDVDDTLLYGTKQVNLALLKELKAKGITEVYLFTNMGLNDIKNYGHELASMSRYELIQILKTEGFNVLGVITSADPGYIDEKGRVRPIGSAYNELYLPLMEQVRKNGPIDLQNYNSNKEDLATYFINDTSWRVASSIVRARCETLFPQTKKQDGVLSLQLRQKIDGKNAEILTNYAEVLSFLEDEEKCKQYTIDSGVDEQVKLEIRGSATKDNKALMMQQTVGELLAYHGGPIAISFFDDTQAHLSGAIEAMKPYIDAGLVSLSTCLMSRNYNISQGADAIQLYAHTIEQNEQSINAHKKIEVALSTINSLRYRFRSESTAESCKETLKQNLPYATSAQLVTLAKMTMDGTNPLAGSSSPKVAFKYLEASYLKASEEEKGLIAVEILRLLAKHSYRVIKNSAVTDPAIDGLVVALHGLARNASAESQVAIDLAQRCQEINHLILSTLKKLDPLYERETSLLHYWGEKIDEAIVPICITTHCNVAPVNKSGEDKKGIDEEVIEIEEAEMQFMEPETRVSSLSMFASSVSSSKTPPSQMFGAEEKEQEESKHLQGTSMTSNF
ncbi:hypothetical protein Lgra_1011 [Legionella gratiana]|uniref:Uncharacterized protein n=1 Tax=Legionella gratiana TaxID=45066 RepID=A0A378J1G3_9GAMM|nr:hypothetical protein [Legionella gratiana]KTD11553.1 hypothetical protein Lgra_1011 [Legionella gratiana]STX41379.1 Uncharacterised protein [Legionella gratiana]